ncbi:ribosome recycling factor [Thiomicrospira sp. WB1]|uniref:ribosome recycling factor n=1 Tax=Thiomicrospira sp. WB1 TaxID=1685380 RepID=UPI0007496CB5|nr:ribosome recycling factor [Thiomicrospira sp. WB1]KUJ72102.1 ribosome recycling factor [Thiomicrospira sp. WB1]
MLEDIFNDASERMDKSVESLEMALAKIRTGRAHPSILDAVKVDYYGAMVPVSQVANVNVEDARTLTVQPWEAPMIPTIEKAIMTSELGINPVTHGNVMRIPMPPLTEERRKEFIKLARSEAENARVAVRNIRRDANADFKALNKEKEITDDEMRESEDRIQKLTDEHVQRIEKILSAKETSLLEV